LTTGSDATGFTALVTAIAVALSLGAGVVLGPLLAPALRNELTHLHRHRPKVIGSTTTHPDQAKSTTGTAASIRSRTVRNRSRMPSLAGAGTIPTGARPGDFDTTKD
jgi:hypothetical protein